MIGRNVLNDIHSELNRSEAAGVIDVDCLAAIRAGFAEAETLDLPVAIAGGRHAMGGQQFCDRGLVFDTRRLKRVLGMDTQRGIVEVEAGIQWPELIAYLNRAQAEDPEPWVILQKQTGADRLSIGGSIAANIHGRGLTMRPFISDIESLVLVTANGQTLNCDRKSNSELFRLVAGGYGLFGCVYSAKLKLTRRRVLERIVELETIDNIAARLAERIADGFEYGDFQFATNPASADFLHRGIFACYRPIERTEPLQATQHTLSQDDWRKLIVLAHTDKQRAFEIYSQHYLATSGQLYFSDLHQLSEYEDGYHGRVDEAIGAPTRGSEMISELYVPRDRLGDFMAAAADDFRRHEVNVIYGTVRLIERDDESFLAWARQSWACVIFNLHADHTANGIERTAEAFRRLIDLAIERGGSYFLTYHRWASREQIEQCHPKLTQFLQLKQAYDPDGRLQSDWYRHYRTMFSDALESRQCEPATRRRSLRASA